MNVSEALEVQLRSLVEKRGLIVVGYGASEPLFYAAFAKNPAKVFDVNPRSDSSRRQAMSVFGKALTEVRGKDARFENFVQGLCCELLGQRSEWSCDRSVNKRLVTSTLTWKDRKPIQQAIDRIEGHSRKNV